MPPIKAALNVWRLIRRPAQGEGAAEMWYNRTMNYFLNIPNKVYGILTALERAGFDAYVVGGCVRDLLMGKTPHDWDVTTSAKPDEIKSVFKDRKLVETGLKHGTVTVVVDGEPFEITTFRSDGAYSDGRHPDSVAFTDDIKTDLARRDFTMNALAYSPGKGLVDEFGGVGDIKDGVIRCVGDPDERFSEDVLRVMRAIRFTATLGNADPAERDDGTDGAGQNGPKNAGQNGPDAGNDAGSRNAGRSRAVREAEGQMGLISVLFGAASGFEPDKETLRAVQNHAGEVGKTSAERITAEFTKLILGNYAAYAVRKFRRELDTILRDKGLRISDRKSVKALEFAPKDLALRLALVLEADGEDGLRTALAAMKYPAETVKRAALIKEVSAQELVPEERVIRLEMRKLAGAYPDEEVPDVLADGVSVRALKGKMNDAATEKTFTVIGGILERGDCFSRRGLAVGGDDLAESGIPEGELVGKILDALLDEVIAGETENEKAALLKRAAALRGLYR